MVNFSCLASPISSTGITVATPCELVIYEFIFPSFLFTLNVTPEILSVESFTCFSKSTLNFPSTWLFSIVNVIFPSLSNSNFAFDCILSSKVSKFLLLFSCSVSFKSLKETFVALYL